MPNSKRTKDGNIIPTKWVTNIKTNTIFKQGFAGGGVQLPCTYWRAMTTMYQMSLAGVSNNPERNPSLSEIYV